MWASENLALRTLGMDAWLFTDKKGNPAKALYKPDFSLEECHDISQVSVKIDKDWNVETQVFKKADLVPKIEETLEVVVSEVVELVEEIVEPKAEEVPEPKVEEKKKAEKKKVEKKKVEKKNVKPGKKVSRKVPVTLEIAEEGPVLEEPVLEEPEEKFQMTEAQQEIVKYAQDMFQGFPESVIINYVQQTPGISLGELVDMIMCEYEDTSFGA